MIEQLKKVFTRLRAWMAENERAHRNARADACCSNPSEVYAARTTEKRDTDKDEDRDGPA